MKKLHKCNNIGVYLRGAALVLIAFSVMGIVLNTYKLTKTNSRDRYVYDEFERAAALASSSSILFQAIPLQLTLLGVSQLVVLRENDLLQSKPLPDTNR